jgi:hypothetical protein
MLSYLITTHKCFQHFCSLFWDDETEDVEYCRSGLIYRTDESTEMKRSKPLGWFFKDLPGLGIKRLQSCLRLSFYRSYLIIMTNDIMKMNASLPSCYEYTSRTHTMSWRILLLTKRGFFNCYSHQILSRAFGEHGRNLYPAHHR